MVDSVNLRPARAVTTPRVLVSGPYRSLTPVVANSVSLDHARVSVKSEFTAPPQDVRKIEMLRNAIADGSYRIDLGGIADAMIRFSGDKS